jgi:hypothetical protein
LVGKLKDERPLERSRSRRKDNIKIDIREIKLEVLDGIYLA